MRGSTSTGHGFQTTRFTRFWNDDSAKLPQPHPSQLFPDLLVLRAKSLHQIPKSLAMIFFLQMAHFMDGDITQKLWVHMYQGKIEIDILFARTASSSGSHFFNRQLMIVDSKRSCILITDNFPLIPTYLPQVFLHIFS